MKKITFLFLISFSTLFAQRNKLPQLGQFTNAELQMKIYDKDSSAVAVVLYESANLYLDENYNYRKRTDYYYRIKILDPNGFDYANVSIDFYDKQEVVNIKGLTYNLDENGTINKAILNQKDIFEKDNPNDWKNKTFTLPNIKVGSVIEYTYSKISPYYKIDDWYFQSNIPKIKSEFDAAILGNYKYNVRINGFLKLDKNDPSVIKDCVYIDGLGEGSCMKYSFGMYDIPAFKEEDYMLSKSNYIAKLAFDLDSYTSTSGDKEKYTTTWKEADRKLKNIFLNNQTSKKSFFKRNLPELLFFGRKSI